MSKDWMDELVQRAYRNNIELGAYGGACEWAKNHTDVSLEEDGAQSFS